MISGIYKLIDGSLVQKNKFENICNNLANVNTNAFKKDIISFNQILSLKSSSAIDFTPGPLTYTGNNLDIALDAPGFFKIQTSRGIRYTRDGSFALNVDKFLVTQNGDTVLGQNGPIKINGTDVQIDIDGQVVVENGVVDKILVVDFEQPRFLKKVGSSYYTYQGKEEDILTTENASVRQGYIERSNVNPIEEMIKMVEALRAFESDQKAIQCMDEMNGRIVNDVGVLQ